MNQKSHKSDFFALKLILKTFNENFKKYLLESVETLFASQKWHSNEYFLKFSLKVFRISLKVFRIRPLLIQTLKCWKVFEIFLVKSTSECYFWLANKVLTDSNEYFLKFSLKVFTISFTPKKSLLGHFWFKL